MKFPAKELTIASIVIVLILGGIILYNIRNSESPIQNQPPLVAQNKTNGQPAPITASSTNSSILAMPISPALERTTKKIFGVKISPGDSPISPEIFSGYHTGVDFETTPDEQNIDMPIFAACSGPLLFKKWATGYGGVAAQLCQLENSEVTIVYGHLKLLSISAKTGDNLTAGEQIGILGKGYSTETDNERKHLHLGIHKGSSINIKGYVQSQSELTGWLNPLNYLK